MAIWAMTGIHHCRIAVEQTIRIPTKAETADAGKIVQDARAFTLVLKQLLEQVEHLCLL